MYIVKTIDDMGYEIWDEYVAKHENGTGFHTSYMYEVWRGVPRFSPFAYCAVDKHGRICALLCGYIQTILSGLLSNLSRRSILLQAPLYHENAALGCLLDSYQAFSKEQKVVYTEVRNHYFKDGYRVLMHGSGYKWEGHYNIIKELPSTNQELWKQIHRKRKDGINKAQKCGLTLVTDVGSHTVDDFYRLLKLKYLDLGLPIPPKCFFQNCISYDHHSNCRYIQLAEDDKIRVSLLALIYKRTFHAIYIGNDTDPTFLKKRPIDFFYYKVMEYCIDNGIQYFDWMGAGKPGVPYGVRDFKLQFGGELTDYGRFVMASRPILMKISSVGFNALKLIKKLKNR